MQKICNNACIASQVAVGGVRLDRVAECSESVTFGNVHARFPQNLRANFRILQNRLYCCSHLPYLASGLSGLPDFDCEEGMYHGYSYLPQNQ
jgi:hypothetical protein